MILSSLKGFGCDCNKNRLAYRTAIDDTVGQSQNLSKSFDSVN